MFKDLFSLEPDAYVDLYFYHSGDDTCDAALSHPFLPAVHLDIPIPAWDTCFDFPVPNAKMKCLPDGRIQETKFSDDNCTIPTMINSNHTAVIFENGGCNAQGEHFFLVFKWDPEYCQATHRVTSSYVGCYQDSSQARILSYQAPDEFGKSLDDCATHCLTL